MADDTLTVEQAKARLDAAVNAIERGFYGAAEREYEAAKDALIAVVRAEKTPISWGCASCGGQLRCDHCNPL